MIGFVRTAESELSVRIDTSTGPLGEDVYLAYGENEERRSVGVVLRVAVLWNGSQRVLADALRIIADDLQESESGADLRTDEPSEDHPRFRSAPLSCRASARGRGDEKGSAL